MIGTIPEFPGNWTMIQYWERQEKEKEDKKIYEIRTGVSGVSAGNPCNILACLRLA